MSNLSRRQKGFTIVELLIVIVVVAILAAITIVAYNGIQQRARDSQRKNDVKTIVKAIELYYADNGSFPTSNCTLGTGCAINSAWTTTADASWPNFVSQLVPQYLASVPKDPLATTSTSAAIHGGYNYDYVSLTNTWCNASATKPVFLFSYKLENGSQDRVVLGDCQGTQPTNYQSSEYILVK
jgi:type II secretion system protein G